jgi:hypothetical protein
VLAFLSFVPNGKNYTIFGAGFWVASDCNSILRPLIPSTGGAAHRRRTLSNTTRIEIRGI